MSVQIEKTALHRRYEHLLQCLVQGHHYSVPLSGAVAWYGMVQYSMLGLEI